MKPDETHREYAQRVGPPRVVACEMDISGGYWVWVCRSHDYRYSVKVQTLHSVPDRCPMSRLEEWRARVWEAGASVVDAIERKNLNVHVTNRAITTISSRPREDA